MSTEKFESDFLPVLPLKEVVVFPGSITPLFVMRSPSVEALEDAVSRDNRLFVVCQRDSEEEDPGIEDLHEVGTVAEILQVVRSGDGTVKILIEGSYPARVVQSTVQGNHLQAFVVRVAVGGRQGESLEAQRRNCLRLFERYAMLSEKVPNELVASVRSTLDPLAFLYAVGSYAHFRPEEKQEILESVSLEEKLILLCQFLEAENQMLELENKIAGQVKTQIGRSQREYYLNEQLKAIESELGIGPDGDPELSQIAQAIEESGMPAEAREKAGRELSRLARMPAMSPEAAVTRTYLEWLVDLPWENASVDTLDLAHARAVLEEDHHGLEKIKERIVEYLAVAKLVGRARGPILCFVGPPGVGKTSLGRSIARCVGRQFIRISLGGVRDEAEIRGHRRTYVGAMPGKLIQSMKRAGTVNPVILLDEIDKMSSDFRGDPASALLEVLDPEQNRAFNDHYVEVDYDLSKVMFLTTANSIDGIPYPLLDRMELIRLPGYTEEEKTQIAIRHLLPRQRRQHGLKSAQVQISRPIVRHVIAGYTREAGVRNLDRELEKICRKVAREIVDDPGNAPRRIGLETVREFLGPVRYRDNPAEKKPEVGTCLGLAWTETGGEMLPVEVSLMPGKGNLVLTGKLGEVMQESAKTALSYIRAHADELGIAPDFNERQDIHIHLPEGAIAKDGPSAGITMATALASALSRRPVRQDTAMTGEITLRGRVLKIGGLKEKVLAAHRVKIRTIILPRENLDDLGELADNVRRQMRFIPVENLWEVLAHMLKPAPRTAAGRRTRGGSRQARAGG